MAKGFKTGGRQKGTPNKATKFGRDAISDFINDYISTGMLSNDFRNVDADKRLDFIIKIASFIIPKPQSIDMSVNGTLAHKTAIDDVLAQLAKDNDI